MEIDPSKKNIKKLHVFHSFKHDFFHMMCLVFGSPKVFDKIFCREI